MSDYTFNISVNEEGASVLSIISDKGETRIFGTNKITLSYSNKGKNKGTKISTTMVVPVFDGDFSDVRPETFILPEDVDKVIAASKFLSQGAIRVKPGSLTQAKKDEEEIPIKSKKSSAKKRKAKKPAPAPVIEDEDLVEDEDVLEDEEELVLS